MALANRVAHWGVLYIPGTKWWEIVLEFMDKYSSKVAPRFFIRRFTKLYGYSYVWQRTYWLGVPAMKCPLDFWIYQEIIWETRPQVIIETGSKWGGSALFFASICDLMGEGKVVTIDVDDSASRTLSHPRITTIVGDSVSEDVISQVRKIVGHQTAMVSLDSDHSKRHVLKEMELYSEFVPVGKYMVVEDTGLRGPGPRKAIEEFLRHRNDFVPDMTREKFMLTGFHGGFLIKKQPPAEASQQ